MRSHVTHLVALVAVCLAFPAASHAQDPEPPPDADLSVLVTGGPNPVDPDGTFTTTVTLRNDGPSDASPTVGLSPVGPLEFVSLSAPAGWSCSTPAVGDQGQTTCAISSLAVGPSATFTLVSRVPRSTAIGTAVGVGATVWSSTTADPDADDDTGAASAVVGTPLEADLSLAGTAHPAVVKAGGTATYRFDVTNTGPDAAAGVTISGVLPGDATLAAAPVAPEWACGAPSVGGSGLVSCTLPGTLPSGATAGISVIVRIPEGTPDDTTYDFQATTTTTTLDLVGENDTATAGVVVGSVADLAVSVTGAPATALRGQRIAYDVALAAAGPDAATGARLDLLLGDGTALAGFQAPTGWTCTTPALGGGGTIACARQSLVPGSATAEVLVDVRADAAIGTTARLRAAVGSAVYDPTPENAVAVATTTVVAPEVPAVVVPPALQPPPTPPVVLPPAAPRCARIPSLVGRTRGTAQTLLRRGSCRLAVRVVTRGKPTKGKRRVRVVRQSLRPGTIPRAGATITLTLAPIPDRRG